MTSVAARQILNFQFTEEVKGMPVNSKGEVEQMRWQEKHKPAMSRDYKLWATPPLSADSCRQNPNPAGTFQNYREHVAGRKLTSPDAASAVRAFKGATVASASLYGSPTAASVDEWLFNIQRRQPFAPNAEQLSVLKAVVEASPSSYCEHTPN